MTVRNESTVRLFLPLPEITGLQFGNRTTMQVAEWYTHLLVSSARTGMTLEPGEAHPFEWRVRPASIELPEMEDHLDFDYRRWCVALVSGEYLVWYQWSVQEDFFDPDSHMRLPDLERAAAQAGAVVWRGQALSNRLQVAYADLLPQDGTWNPPSDERL